MHTSNSLAQSKEETELLEILFQDEFMVAIHKPAGMLVHKSPIDKYETRYAMKILRNQIGQWVYPIHRLDKPTSGLLLFALHPEIAKKIGQLFNDNQIKKQYLAIVRGHTHPEGKIDHPLKEIAVFKHLAEQAQQKEAKDACTDFKLIERYELPFSDGRFETSRYSMIQLFPKTGRKHQIRRHLKHISHPIIGDVKYGKGEHNRLFKDKLASNRLLLAAQSMTFPHPNNNEEITLHCPLEKNFSDTLGKLRGAYLCK